jgi:phytoene desaturase
MVFLGNSPDNAPALYSIMSHVDLGLGVHYPAGGMGKITEGLMKLGRSLGVQYRMNEAVMKITSDGKRVRSVHTSRDTYPADIVVANADYAHVETQLLDEKDRSYPPRYWKKRTYAPSMFIAYLGLSKKLKKLSHHNLYFSEEWQNHFSTIFTTKQWPTNPCFYLSCPSVTDASVAPRGKENLFLLIPIAPGLEDSDEIREKYFDMALAHVEKITGEKIRANIEVKRIYSLNDYRNDYNAWDGTALGLSHTLMQTAIFRPKRRSGKLSNLYYCSQYTHPGVGVPMTFIAAQIAAERISKDYAL